jgi:hypothetical protein
MARATQSKGSDKQDDGDDKVPRSEMERYREAAEDLMSQLDWAIGYLHGIRKPEVSNVLAKNRAFIRKKLMDKPEEQLPAQQTDET